MTPERIVVIVALWARFYTRHVPEQDGLRRVDELRADLHDHIAHERAHGTDERRIALSIAARMLRGLAADVSWCRERTPVNHTQENRMRPTSLTHRSAIRVASVTACLLLVPFVLTVAAEGADWGVFDFVFAGAIIAGAGTLVELALSSRGPALYAVALVGCLLGVAAMIAGELDDAPGLFGLGLLLILGMATLTFRSAQRSH